MEILDVKKEINENKLKEIAKEIRNGKICLFPTETVYGIGTNALNENAVEKIYEIKKRKKSNPINLLVNNMNMIEEITQDISPLEYQLMENFFPGPFTIILKRKNIIPDLVTANSNLVGIRMSSSIIVTKLLDFAGVPIATPSANISGKLSGTNFADIIDDFSQHLDFAIDGGESTIGIESTIVRVIDHIPHILRPGFITPEQIKKIAGDVIVEGKENNILPSSTMGHYQLDVDSTLIYSQNNQKMVNQIISLAQKYKNPVVLCCSENIEFYSKQNFIKKVISVSSKNNLENYSKNLFSSLRKASYLSPDMILVEGVKKEGLGIAIMNRLENTCKTLYIEK